MDAKLRADRAFASVTTLAVIVAAFLAAVSPLLAG